MSVLVDIRTNGTFTAGATTLSWTHTVSAGLSNSILLVAASTGKAPPHATVSGVNWDDLGTPVALAEKGTGIAESTDSVFGDLWFLKNPVPGTSKTIKITASTSCEITGSSSSYQNVDQANPFNAASPQTAIGTANPQPSLAVTSATGEIVVDAVAVNEAGTSTLVQGAGQTVIGINQVGAGKHTAGSSDAPGAASVTMSWTGVSIGDIWCQIAVSLKAAAADIGSAVYQRTRAGRGPGAGPSMRRMLPQQFPTPSLIDTVSPGQQIQPLRSRGPGMGPRLRRMVPQRLQDAGATTTTLLPTDGAITIAGVAASLTLAIAAVAGAITIAGNAPSVTTILQGVQGSIVIAGNAASTTSILAPAVGAVVISGSAPALTQTLVGITGAVTIGGNAPSQTSILAATDGAVVIGGNAPSLVVSSGLSPTEGAISISGNAPDLLSILAALEGAATIAGNMPNIVGVGSVVEQASNWQSGHQWRSRTKKERKAEEDRQRIELGILPPELEAIAEQAVSDAVSASTELAAGRVEPQNAIAVAMQAREEYDSAYKQAYKGAYIAEVVAELWKEDVKRAQRRRAVALLLLH